MRPPAECACVPMPLPCTVIRAEPVPARFTLRTTLRPATSNDQPTVTLPTRPPCVRTRRRDPAAPPTTRHVTDVSESHSVISHFVDPALATPVVCTAPMFVPCTVTSTDPVPARFAARSTLALVASTENPWLTDPPCVPTLITTRPDPRAFDALMRHFTDVSDCHPVLSHPVPANRIVGVYLTGPMLAPCTVMDAEPVLARLPTRIRLNPPASTDHP